MCTERTEGGLWAGCSGTPYLARTMSSCPQQAEAQQGHHGHTTSWEGTRGQPAPSAQPGDIMDITHDAWKPRNA